MHIAIDASRTTVQKVTGTEYYATQLIRALIQHDTEHEFTLYFRNTPPDNLFPPSKHIRHRVIPFLRLWTHFRFAASLWQDRPDVTFVPAHTLPLLFPGRAVVTVHDLGFRYFPQAHPISQRLYLALTTRYSANRASIVLADSQATADDLTRFYGTPAEKIRVVYPGVEAPPIGDLAAVKRKYGLPERYFLFIGTLQPRKNIARIVQAYARWRKAHSNDTVGLVLAGSKGWLYDPAWVTGVDGVYLPGYIDDADKGALYSGAIALVFPSLYEGFGFPLLEAMHCGAPVITSNTSSLPELARDAALLINPLAVEEIAQAMGQLSDDDNLRWELREQGYRQTARFTWAAAAEQAMEVLEETGKQIASFLR